jgi:hypothetical protein
MQGGKKIILCLLKRPSLKSLPASKGGELWGFRFPPLEWEAGEKFKLRDGKASLVVRGRGKFRPPKPVGEAGPQNC